MQFLPFQLIQTPLHQDAEREQQSQDGHEDSNSSTAA